MSHARIFRDGDNFYVSDGGGKYLYKREVNYDNKGRRNVEFKALKEIIQKPSGFDGIETRIQESFLVKGSE